MNELGQINLFRQEEGSVVTSALLLRPQGACYFITFAAELMAGDNNARGMMRILITLILWAVIFCAGAMTGNRYGVPEAVSNITNGGFEFVEDKLSGLMGSEDS